MREPCASHILSPPKRNSRQSHLSPLGWVQSNLIGSQMGLTRVLNFLPKASKTPTKYSLYFPNISCTPTTQTVPLRSFASTSLVTIKNPFETNDKNADVIVSDGVLKDAESICKMLSKSSGSSVEASLARASI